MKQIELLDMEHGKMYQIVSIKPDCEYSSKLEKMGFAVNTKLCLAVANFSDPFVVKIRDSRIALRKKEAKGILIKEVKND